MYKVLLCWRYLLTRYLALACIISVMLGVATLIVVNSVMGGFSFKLRERLHGLLSDVIIESTSLEGFSDPEAKMALIRKDEFLNERIVAMTAAMEVPAMLQWRLGNGQMMTRPVRVIGVNPKTRTEIGGFSKHLMLQKNAANPDFVLTHKMLEKYYDDVNKEARPRFPQIDNNPIPWLKESRRAPKGQPHTSKRIPFQEPLIPQLPPPDVPKKQPLLNPLAPQGRPDIPLPPPVSVGEQTGTKLEPIPDIIRNHKPYQTPKIPKKVFQGLPKRPPTVPAPPKVEPIDMSAIAPPAPPPVRMKKLRGVIVGNLIASFRVKGAKPNEVQHRYLLHPGSQVILTTVGAASGKVAPVFDRFEVVDYFQSEMSEYDSNYVFVSLDYLQKLRGMDNRVSALQIRLKNYERDKEKVVEKLRAIFPRMEYRVDTWEGKQGPLLEAINIEKGILNVLLFLIICVAGFGILAIFSMIVTEKTRDIGVMKALGASNRGVMMIFLSYGLLLGLVGAGLGTVLGIALTNNINEVETLLSYITGQKVFSPEVYYFDEIPTQIQPWGIVFLNAGAIAISVFFSVLPALRAAMLHPVRALRYE